MICEFGMLATCDFVLKSDVVENNFMMGSDEFGSKFAFNVITVLKEFISSVRKSEPNGF
jgi:hypothetical protein